jgi:hypothetical protein
LDLEKPLVDQQPRLPLDVAGIEADNRLRVVGVQREVATNALRIGVMRGSQFRVRE